MSAPTPLRAAFAVLGLIAGEAQAGGATCGMQRGIVASNIAAASFDLGLSAPDIPRRVVQFSTPLMVTTDGAPNSFKLDLKSKVPELSSLCNAFAVYMVDADDNRTGRVAESDCPAKLRIFRAFERGDWSQPAGYEVSWRAGFAARERGGELVPCVFSSGPYAGFIGSKTNLKNGLDSNRGECDIADQVNPLTVPGITIQGGANFIRSAGVQLGDLAIATLTKVDGSTVDVPAMIVDTGGTPYPAMGSVALNAALLERPVQATSRAEVYSYQIPNPVMITIVTGSAGYRLQRPYSAANVAERLTALLTEARLDGTSALRLAIGDCSARGAGTGARRGK